MSLLEHSQEELRAAHILIGESLLSAAASRAYYALFYVAQALLFEEDLRFSSHGEVHGAFGKEFAKNGKMDPKFHRYLLDAYHQRQDADYEMNFHIASEDVLRAVQWGEEFLEAAKKYLKL